MPTLRIVVLAPPADWDCYRNVRLTLQHKKGDDEPVQATAERVVFEVPYDLREGVPSGPYVFFNSDKRRFIYLRWSGETNGGREMFRRMKLFFEDMPAGADEILVPGRDAKGAPSCARVRALS